MASEVAGCEAGAGREPTAAGDRKHRQDRVRRHACTQQHPPTLQPRLDDVQRVQDERGGQPRCAARHRVLPAGASDGRTSGRVRRRRQAAAALPAGAPLLAAAVHDRGAWHRRHAGRSWGELGWARHVGRELQRSCPLRASRLIHATPPYHCCFCCCVAMAADDETLEGSRASSGGLAKRRCMSAVAQRAQPIASDVKNRLCK